MIPAITYQTVRVRCKAMAVHQVEVPNALILLLAFLDGWFRASPGGAVK